MHLSKPVVGMVRAIAVCIIAASAASPAFAQVNHNAPTKFGATLYMWRPYDGNPGYTVLPDTNIYPPSIPWDINQTAWWNSVVDSADAAGLGYLTVPGWGYPSNSDPADIQPLLNALDARGSGMKLALFDDPTGAILRKNKAKHGSWTTDIPFDLADGATEGGWYYFYDMNWRRYFSAFYSPYPNRTDRLLRVDGRPVVFMWHSDRYTNIQYFSNLVAALRAACQSDFGFNPYIIIEESMVAADPDTLADATFDWFDPQQGTLSSHTNPYTNEVVSVGVAVPGYDGHLFHDLHGDNSYRPGPWSRNNGTTYTNALNIASVGDLVLIESINNVEENAHLMASSAWGNQYIDITRAYAYPTNGGGGSPSGDSELTQGESLNPGQLIRSPDGRFTFTYQLDGNVVLYQTGNAIWASGSVGYGAGGQLLMQPDGNLVLYGQGGIWHTFTYGSPGAKLKVQNDGNAVIHNASGQWIWRTYTCCR